MKALHSFSILTFAMALILMSCNHRPKGVLSDKEMVDLIADMEVAEVYMQRYYPEYYNDSARDKAVQWVLDKHNISKAEFDSTMNWYGRNIDQYKELYVKVDKNLAEKQRKIAGETETNDVATDLWPYSRHIYISSKGASSGISFSFPSDDIQRGDRITWKLHLKGTSEGNIMLGVDYENGTSSYISRTQNGNQRVEVTLQTDTATSVRRIFGVLNTANNRDVPIWVDSIALQHSAIDSTQYYRYYSQTKYSGPTLKNKKENEVKDAEGDVDTKTDEKTDLTQQPINQAKEERQNNFKSRTNRLNRFNDKEQNLNKRVKLDKREPLKMQ